MDNQKSDVATEEKRLENQRGELEVQPEETAPPRPATAGAEATVPTVPYNAVTGRADEKPLDRGNVTNEPAPGSAPDKEGREAAVPAKKKTLEKGSSLDELKYKQSVEPESIKHSKGNVDGDYEVAEHEENLVHARLERKVFDQATGDKKSKAYVQKFWPLEFADLIARNGLPGYSIDILHKPAELDRIEKARSARKQ